MNLLCGIKWECSYGDWQQQQWQTMVTKIIGKWVVDPFVTATVTTRKEICHCHCHHSVNSLIWFHTTHLPMIPLPLPLPSTSYEHFQRFSSLKLLPLPSAEQTFKVHSHRTAMAAAMAMLSIGFHYYKWICSHWCAMAMAPQVNGFWPYSCSCGNSKLIVLIVICHTSVNTLTSLWQKSHCRCRTLWMDL